METSFEFLKHFDTQKDKLEVISLQSKGYDEISVGELNPITKKPLEKGLIGFAKNRIMKIFINNKIFYIWSFWGEGSFIDKYNRFYILISNDKDFNIYECFDCYELGIYYRGSTDTLRVNSVRSNATSELKPSLIIRFLNFFLDRMDSEYSEELFDDDLREEGEIEFIKTNSPIDTETNFSEHKYNWKVEFDKSLMDQLDKYCS
jgi:hypothetical protein